MSLYKGLIALQHRGQDSAGIACCDGHRINLKKGLGLVSDVFTEQNLSVLKGTAGIGHVRYTTVGGTPKVDAQPFKVDLPHTLSIAYNGNVVNYHELRDNYSGKVESNCDAEVILHVMIDALRGKELSVDALFDSVRAVMDKVNGSYSVVCVVEDKGVLAFRDPHAIRPLALGKGVDGSYAFASETVAFDAIGFEFVRDVKGGEAVFITNDLQVHSQVLKQEQEFHCMFEWVYFARPDSVIDGLSVYEARMALGREVAGQVERNGKEVVVPVPDTSRPAALAIARALSLPFEEGLIKNRYVGRTFIMPTDGQRDKALNIKLNVLSPVMSGKDIFLVDDSIVRGNTARKIVKSVKKKANKVHMLVTCPPLVKPCYYGVDFPTQDELIASKKTVEEIRQFLELDGLTYIKLDGLKKSLKCGGLCTACLGGGYPTIITPDFEKRLVEERRKARKEVEESNG